MSQTPGDDTQPRYAHASESTEPVAGRQVILGDAAGVRLPQEGWVTAARPERLTIRTNTPFQRGERLFVEFPVGRADKLQRTAIIRGEVAAMHETADGPLVDIRLNLMSDAASGLTPVLSREDALSLLATAKKDLDHASEAGALPIADLTPLLEMPREADELHPRNRQRRLAAFAGVAALCALVLLMRFLDPDRKDRFPRASVRGLPAQQVTEPTAEDALEDAALHLELPHDTTAGTGPPDPFRGTLRQVWHPGTWVRIETPAVLEAPLEDTAPPEPYGLFAPVGWVMAALQPLDPQHASGWEGGAPPAFVVSETLPAPNAEPDAALSESPRTHYPEQPEAAFNAIQTPSGADRVDALAALAVNEAPDRVTVTVSKSDHMLTIELDGLVAAQFPVGLGHANATPEGDFTIANKITDPDWFDRGRVVKAGDPENPLGKRWMGLGVDGQATSYGIHPTDEPESIGADLSRGCIRMRPEDAELVFRLCPIGTTVCIKP